MVRELRVSSWWTSPASSPTTSKTSSQNNHNSHDLHLHHHQWNQGEINSSHVQNIYFNLKNNQVTLLDTILHHQLPPATQREDFIMNSSHWGKTSQLFKLKHWKSFFVWSSSADICSEPLWVFAERWTSFWNVLSQNWLTTLNYCVIWRKWTHFSLEYFIPPTPQQLNKYTFYVFVVTVLWNVCGTSVRRELLSSLLVHVSSHWRLLPLNTALRISKL